LVSIKSEYLLNAVSVAPSDPRALLSLTTGDVLVVGDGAVASESFNPGLSRLAASPPGLGLVEGTVGADDQFGACGRPPGGSRPASPPAKAPTGTA
jgi:hypothetical protein